MDYSDLLGPCVFAMAGDKGVSIRQGFFFLKFFFLVFTYQEKKPEADVIEDNDN